LVDPPADVWMIIDLVFFVLPSPSLVSEERNEKIKDERDPYLISAT
jgi:hypothetical protein